MPIAMATFQESLPGLVVADVRLPSDHFQAKLDKIMADDVFDTELQKASIHINGAIPKAASGKSCGITIVEVIKEHCNTSDSYSASGTLSQLDLKANAISSLDTGTIKMVMDQATNTNRLRELIGPITTNIDTWSGSEFTQLIRADKDGYVQALCLIIFWSSDDEALSTALSSLATDLIFKFQKLGQGLGQLLKCMCDMDPWTCVICTHVNVNWAPH